MFQPSRAFPTLPRISPGAHGGLGYTGSVHSICLSICRDFDHPRCGCAWNIAGGSSCRHARYLVQHMRGARLAGWRLEPASGGRKPLDRVEWSFKLAPYAGGEVLSFAPGRKQVRRRVIIGAALYFHGKYQTHVAGQAIIREGAPHDLNLAAEVARLTQNLLAPKLPATPSTTADGVRSRRQNEVNLGVSMLPHL